MRSKWNPLSFTTGPVSFWLSIVYVLLISWLIFIHTTVPSIPKPYQTEKSKLQLQDIPNNPDTPPENEIPSHPIVSTDSRKKGKRFNVDLDEAWNDLQQITKNFHPFNSHANDEVRDYLEHRIEEIVRKTGASWSRIDTRVDADRTDDHIINRVLPNKLNSKVRREATTAKPITTTPSAEADVVLFNDLLSNVTAFAEKNEVSYFEGTNLIVYIRGTEDPPGAWWERREYGHGGILINAHYDSVPVAYGATDDGIGIVTILQLVRHFASNKPKHGVVALLNNAEEEYLWGARAFGSSPVQPFCREFLNLEGVGTGGRPILFRASDADIVRDGYHTVRRPVGGVIASDGFQYRLIRSQTDYIVFHDSYGQQGLDVAFYEPRSRYHTTHDNTQHLDYESVWYMLSVSLETVDTLSSRPPAPASANTLNFDTTSPPTPPAQRSLGVWFDLFGQRMVVIPLDRFFALSIFTLVATPIILGVLTFLLIQKGKWYPFSTSIDFVTPASTHIRASPSSRAEASTADADTNTTATGTMLSSASPTVALGGWRGAFRFPVAFVFTVVVAGLTIAFIDKVNPLIVYDSLYTTWALFFSIVFFSLWFVLRGASAMRPTALQRFYVLLWLYSLGWVIHVAAAVVINRLKVAAVYPIVIAHISVFLALFISYLEFFSLPTKADYARESLGRLLESDAALGDDPSNDQDAQGEGSISTAPNTSRHDEEEDGDPSEASPLLGSRHHTQTTSTDSATTFASNYRRHSAATAAAAAAAAASSPKDGSCLKLAEEQGWAEHLPSSSWFIQFLLLSLFSIVPMLSVGLLLSTATFQTGPDGGGVLAPYFFIAGTTIFVTMPLMPFIHRAGAWLSKVALLTAILTMLYAMFAFPFSVESRYKSYFVQEWDLDTDVGSIRLAGLERYTRPILESLPSSRLASRGVECAADTEHDWSLSSCWIESKELQRPLLRKSEPQVALNESSVQFKVLKKGRGHATFQVHGEDSRVCTLKLDSGDDDKSPKRVFNKVHVHGSVPDPDSRLQVNQGGFESIHLYRRDRSQPFIVDVTWQVDSRAALLHQQQQGEGRLSEVETEEWEETALTELEGVVACIWADANEPGLVPGFDELVKYAPRWAGFTTVRGRLLEAKKRFHI